MKDPISTATSGVTGGEFTNDRKYRNKIYTQNSDTEFPYGAERITFSLVFVFLNWSTKRKESRLRKPLFVIYDDKNGCFSTQIQIYLMEDSFFSNKFRNE